MSTGWEPGEGVGCDMVWKMKWMINGQAAAHTDTLPG